MIYVRRPDARRRRDRGGRRDAERWLLRRYIIVHQDHTRVESMSIKAARLKDRHTVHPENTGRALAMAVGTFSVLLLFSLVAAYSAVPTIIDTRTREDIFHRFGRNHAKHEPSAREESTLSTELQPPPFDEREHYATVYIINFYAVKNLTSNVSEEMFENDIIDSAPAILEPSATVLLVVEHDKEEEREKHLPVDLDEFAEGLEDQGFKVDRIDRNGKTKLLKVKMEKAKAESMIESSLQTDDEIKTRRKRTVCYKCGGGGRGRWGGGGYPSGGYYPSGGGGGGYYPSGGSYPSGGGGGRGGGGCRGCGGGGGGGGSHASAQASASASSGSWGK